MSTERRRISIYEKIKQQREVSVSDLASFFKVSEMTIRRDLDKLEEANLIQRAYGKAYIFDETKRYLSFDARVSLNSDAKRKIGQICARIIAEKHLTSIYVDGSSTAIELIRALPSDCHITLITNSVIALNQLQLMPWVDTFVIGGMFNHNNETLEDVTSQDICKQLFVDASFTSCSDLSAEGTYDNSISDSQIRRTMMKNSGENYLLADHSKFGHRSIFLLNKWDKINTLVTDIRPSESFMEAMDANNVNVIWE